MKNIIKQFPALKIIVVGDILLDSYQHGKVERISPEAPIPILQYQKQEYRLGGAANVAVNLATLGIRTSLAGVTGEGSENDILLKMLQENKIDSQHIIKTSKRKLTTKTRFVSNEQQLLRVDYEDTSPIETDLLNALLLSLNKNLADYDAIILSDYNKGLFFAESLDRLVELIKKNRIYSAIDPKKNNFPLYKDVDLMTPNHQEAKDDVNRNFETDDDIQKHAPLIMQKHKLQELLITRGKKGMALLLQDKSIHFIPTYAQSVFDVSGAGDTVIATYTAARSAKADPKDAAYLANVAASIVISKFGTSTCNQEELVNQLEFLSKKL